MDSLKQKNLPWLAAYLVLFGVAFAWVFLGRPTAIEAYKALDALDWTKGVSAFAITLGALLLNGLPTSNFKASLVFWEWKNALPSSRFTALAANEHRIDLARLRERLGGQLPASPSEQSSVWYKIYRQHEAEQSVRTGHQDYLLFRDLAWLTVLLCLVGSVVVGCFTASVRFGVAYFAITAVIYLLFRFAACNAGNRFVLTVLACESAKAEDKPRIFVPNSGH